MNSDSEASTDDGYHSESEEPLVFETESEAFYGISENGNEMFPFDHDSSDDNFTDDEDIGKPIVDAEEPPTRRRVNCITRQDDEQRTPRSHEEAMLIDDKAGNNKWRDAETLELNRLMEYKSFRDLGLDVLASMGSTTDPYQWTYTIKQDGQHKSRLVKVNNTVQEAPLVQDAPSDENSDDKSVEDSDSEGPPPLCDRTFIMPNHAYESDSSSDVPPPLRNRTYQPTYESESSSDEDNDADHGEYKRNWPTDFRRGDW